MDASDDSLLPDGTRSDSLTPSYPAHKVVPSVDIAQPPPLNPFAIRERKKHHSHKSQQESLEFVSDLTPRSGDLWGTKGLSVSQDLSPFAVGDKVKILSTGNWFRATVTQVEDAQVLLLWDAPYNHFPPGWRACDQVVLRKPLTGWDWVVEHSCLRDMNIGVGSNILTFCLMVLSLAAFLYAQEMQHHGEQGWEGLRTLSTWTLAFGLFGFSGGITNWLAIKMLFDDVGLWGSGVIPKRFAEIRQAVKSAVMLAFFDPLFLHFYLGSKCKQLADYFQIKQQMVELKSSPDFDAMFKRQIAAIFSRSEGMMLLMMGMSPEMLEPMIRPFVDSMFDEAITAVDTVTDPQSKLNHKATEFFIAQMEALMTQKLEELKPDHVKALTEEMIRRHLSWLIVWGNVFGGAIGIASKYYGYGL